ncbi:hypothetical protein ZWY2020_041199 [Hordeum vulgare]|nr:hypothetical protein ZWY2020_041199 [Hordeum vulgare]
MPVKGSKLPEKTVQEKARTVEKATTVKQPLVKRPASLPTKLNSIKQVSLPSEASNNLVPSKYKSNLKGKLTSSPAIITGKRTSNAGKTGRSSMRSSNASVSGKERSDVPRTPFLIEDEFVASVELQDDVQDSCVTSYNVESTVVELFPDATEYGDISQTAPEEESRINEDDVQGSSITGHLVESALAEQSSHATALADDIEESRPAPKETSGFSLEDDVVESNELLGKGSWWRKVNASVESVITESKEDMELMKTFKDLQNCSTSHCQSVLETSSDGQLPEQSKSAPIDSTLQTDELASVHNNGTFEQAELKSMIVAQQLEELSDDENYEEYDYELIELDEFDAEDEGETINPNDESSKAKGQRPKRISVLNPDDASTSPYKLKFKRGKIVELTPDSNGPRRLIFRRRAANEVANGEGQLVRRIFKRNTRNNGVPTEPDLESPSVKLRHQDTQDKKDAQGLFNNVIEETASKLVESRKSKVHALVGA